VELLRKRLTEYEDAQALYHSRLETQDNTLIGHAFKDMRDKRKNVQFLIPCVGSLILPTGAPVLCEILLAGRPEAAAKEPDRAGQSSPRQKWTDEKGLILLRRDTAWSLANLGDNLKRLQKLPPEQLAAIVGQLETEAAAGESSDRKRAAQQTLEYVRAVQDNKQPGGLGVIGALAHVAGENDEESDRFLRELVALAFNFWNGTEAEEKVIEATLKNLSFDAGKGKEIEIREDD
jgi:hypothetical protein